MTCKSEEKYIDAYDTLTTRLAQAQGALSALMVLYADAENDDHPLGKGTMRDALWGIETLIEQADNAAVLGLSGCRFAEKRCSAGSQHGLRRTPRLVKRNRSGALWRLNDIVAPPLSIGLLDFDNHNAALIPAGGAGLPMRSTECHVQRQIDPQRAIVRVLVASDEPAVIAAVDAECALQRLFQSHDEPTTLAN